MASRRSSSTFDSDAQAYFTATGITDSTIQNAINQLILDFKAASIWTKMLYVFPFPDNSSTHCAYNLVTATSKLTYVGSPTFASTGMTPAASAYADSNVNDNTLTFNDAHISYYSRNDITATQQYVMGVNSSSGGTGCIQEMSINNAPTRQMFSVFYTGTLASSSSIYASTQGLFTSSTQTGALRLYRNGTDLTGTPGTLVNASRGQNFLIGFVLGEATCTAECAFATIGLGLTSTDVANMYTAIQTYQTSLSRQV